METCRGVIGMIQSPALSAAETTLNILSGYLIAVAVNHYVLPLWGFEPSIQDSFAIGAIFATVSWLRSYAWRRLFARV